MTSVFVFYTTSSSFKSVNVLYTNCICEYPLNDLLYGHGTLEIYLNIYIHFIYMNIFYTTFYMYQYPLYHILYVSISSIPPFICMNIIYTTFHMYEYPLYHLLYVWISSIPPFICMNVLYTTFYMYECPLYQVYLCMSSTPTLCLWMSILSVMPYIKLWMSSMPPLCMWMTFIFILHVNVLYTNLCEYFQNHLICVWCLLYHIVWCMDSLYKKMCVNICAWMCPT